MIEDKLSQENTQQLKEKKIISKEKFDLGFGYYFTFQIEPKFQIILFREDQRIWQSDFYQNISDADPVSLTEELNNSDLLPSQITIEYKTMLDPRDIYLSKVAEKPKRTNKIKKVLPKLCSDLGPVPKAYLTSRGFDPAYLQRKYGIMATGPLGAYKFRIIIPIYHQGKIVSFQGRDYTGQSGLRYKSCGIENEIIHHKHLLYGEQFVDSNHIIVVEGPFDQWKMGDNSVALFGTGYTNQQGNLLLKYKKISILFDTEGEAKRHANILGDRMAGLGSEVDLIFLKEGDPGDLPINEAAQLKREILNNI